MAQLLPLKLKTYKHHRGKDPIEPVDISEELHHTRAARYWNLKPWEFRTLAPDHKAEILATYEVEMKIESYYNSEQNRKMDAITK